MLDYLHKLTTRKLCFCIRNRKYEKKYDHIGHPFKHKEVGLTPELIQAYILYELETSYFQIGKVCFKQKNGLPMGGFNSVPLACIDAMVQEHIWANMIRGKIKMRYWDDILIIYPRKLNKNKIENLHNRLNKIYDPDLSVELEGYSNEKIDFLEYIITKELETYHKKKSYKKQYWR